MIDSFDHFIITRFNLKSSYSKIDVNDASWLEERMALFEKYCLPSIQTQTNQNFKWLIFFDPELPHSILNRFRSIKSQYTNLELCFIEKYDFQLIRDECYKFLSKSYLITTRLDSDDMLLNDYIEKTQGLFDFQERLLVNFLNGYCYSENLKLVTKVNRYFGNPFMSHIEKVIDNQPVTVFIDDHDKLKSYPYKKNIDSEGEWVTVIHGNNVINDMVGFPTLHFDRSKIPDIDIHERYNAEFWLLFRKEFKRLIILFRHRVKTKILKLIESFS